MLGLLTTLVVLMIVVGAAAGLLLLGRALVLSLAERRHRELNAGLPLVAAPHGYEASQEAGEVLRETVERIAQKVRPRR
ncbi:MAG TPA: hypothetical protein VFU88_05270 [Ktedonobacterales bacterium]|nr:hypothetical protein [Ktedonobacterales bacterium]